MDPDMEVEVEVLDVTEEEARTLLLSIDPLAALAETQAQFCDRLQELAPPVPEDLRLAWEATARDAVETPPSHRRPQPRLEAQFAVLVTCRDEAQQVELLRRFHAEGLARNIIRACGRVRRDSARPQPERLLHRSTVRNWHRMEWSG
jgi:hypothetical protein